MFKPAVDRFSRTIGRSRSGEERQHIGSSALQSPSQPFELDQLCRQIRRQCVDDRSQELLALVAVGGSVGVDYVLVNSPGDFDFGETRIGEQACDPLLLLGREQISACVQSPPRSIQGVFRSSTMTSGLLLNTTTNIIESITGELDDMEGVHDFDRIGQFLDRGCFEAGESVHRDDVDALTPVLRTGFQPLLEHLLRTSGHHVEQTCWACCLADRGEVDDDGDVLVATPSVPPYVLVDTNDADPVETRRVVDQQPVTFSEDCGVRGVPGHGEFACDHGHGVVVDDEGTQRPVEAGSRDLRSWGRRSSGVLTPYAVALDAFVAAEANMKRGRSVAEGFVGETADDGIANDPVATTPSAPVIGSVGPAFQDGFVSGDVLAGAGEVEGVESAECREVRG